MIRLEIKPRSPGPLANILLTRPIETTKKLSEKNVWIELLVSNGYTELCAIKLLVLDSNRSNHSSVCKQMINPK